MKKLFLFCALIFAGTFVYAQKVYQSGNYDAQRQKSYLTINGTLIEKYTNKGFYWFTLKKNNEVLYVNIIKADAFNKALINDTITLNDCFKLETRQWKRKDK